MNGQLEVEGAAPARPSELLLLAGSAPPAELWSLEEEEEKRGRHTPDRLLLPTCRFPSLRKIPGPGGGWAHLFVRRGVDDVIHGGRRGENGHVSSFEMLDPVTELRPIQTRHHDGVDQLPWEEGGGGQSSSFGPSARWNVPRSDCRSGG